MSDVNFAAGYSPLVSVIIPVYNTERYLEQCLDSILGQTLEDIEVICVDDGSTDSSPQILERYRENDTRVTVLTQKNMYAGVARNRGIDTARGKYLYFMDSDDFAREDMLAEAAARAEQTDADIVVFGGSTYNTVTGKLKRSSGYLKINVVKGLKIFSASDIPRDILTFTNPAPWNKLFRKSFVVDKELRFQALPSSNDVYFTKMALALADRIACVNKDLIRYRTASGRSSQDRKFSDPFRYMQALHALHDGLVSRGIYDELEQGFASYCVNCLRYELLPYRNRPDRMDAYRRVLLDPLVLEQMDHDRDYYSVPDKYDYVKALYSAIEFHEEWARTDWPAAEVTFSSDSYHSEPFFSVIIPVYNGELYIRECIESVYSQGHEDVEIIVVDDGSTDETLAILEGLCAVHDSLTVLHQTNSGQSVARNNGIRRARGEYLIFLDSDDLLAGNAFNNIRKNIGELDVLMYGAEPFLDASDEEGLLALDDKFQAFKKYYRKNGQYSGASISGAELMEQLVVNGDYTPSPCFQAVKRTFFIENDLWFRPGILHEDQLYMFKLLFSADSASIIDSGIYLRRVRTCSVMTSAVTYRNVHGYFISHIELSEYYYDHSDADEFIACQRGAVRIIRMLLDAARRDYGRIDSEEKLFWLGYDEPYRSQFEALITDISSDNKLSAAESRCRDLEKQLAMIRKQLSSEIDRNKKIRNSYSFRIGNAITWLPRRLRS